MILRQEGERGVGGFKKSWNTLTTNIYMLPKGKWKFETTLILKLTEFAKKSTKKSPKNNHPKNHPTIWIPLLPSKWGVRSKSFKTILGISEWSRYFSTIVYRRLLLQTTATSPYLSWSPPPPPRGAAGAWLAGPAGRPVGWLVAGA